MEVKECILDSCEREDLEELIETLSESSRINSDEENLVLDSEDSRFSLSLRIDNLEDPKKLNKFIKSTEILIRRSLEYRYWCGYVNNVLGFDKCEITEESHEDVSIEIHHHPFTLYSIVKSEINKCLASGIKINTLDIALRVLELHYMNKVGYIPLVKTLHEKVHSGKLYIPMELVHGDYKYLMENNLSFLDEDEVSIISIRNNVNFKNCGWNTGYKWPVVKE